MKNNGGPREGGIAILFRTPVTPRDEAKHAGPDFLKNNIQHAAFPLGRRGYKLHILARYFEKDNEKARAYIFEYAATLGNQPIIILGDFNATLGQQGAHRAQPSQALDLALASAHWRDLLEHSTQGTTHRNGIAGRRTDHALVNREAKALQCSAALASITL